MSILLSIDGCGCFQTHNEPLNDRKGRSIFKAYLKFLIGTLKSQSGTLKTQCLVNCIQSAYRLPFPS